MKEFVEKLIERLEEWSFEAEIVIPGSDGYDDTANREIICTKNAISIINQLAEEYNNGWIPCSNRLPEKHGEYIVMIKGAILPTCLMYSPASNEWFSDGEECEYYSVIAWQALPAPYQSKGE